jgi:hypothetical protein
MEDLRAQEFDHNQLTIEQVSQRKEFSAKILSARKGLQTGDFNERQLIRQRQMIRTSLRRYNLQKRN